MRFKNITNLNPVPNAHVCVCIDTKPNTGSNSTMNNKTFKKINL